MFPGGIFRAIWEALIGQPHLTADIADWKDYLFERHEREFSTNGAGILVVSTVLFVRGRYLLEPDSHADAEEGDATGYNHENSHTPESEEEDFKE